MPIVRPIYRTAKQIFQTLFSSSGSSFRRVGLVEFPAPGMWSLVFLTQAPSARDLGAAAAERACLGVHAVYAKPDHRVFLLRAACVTSSSSTSRVEQAMQLLMSAGIIQPGGDSQNQLAALAETARAAQAMRTTMTTAAK